MHITVDIGQTQKFQLTEALLIYKGTGSGCFVSRHPVHTDSGTSQLLPAQPLTKAFVESLAVSLGGALDAEVLPSNVLAKGTRTVAWWTPACHRQMFFTSKDAAIRKLHGKNFPHPPLVWLVKDDQMFVRALAKDARPDGETKLCVAPYWNVGDNGLVCLGDSRTPSTTSVTSLEGWVSGFFESSFTHSNLGRATRHAEGFAGLWEGLAGKTNLDFPGDALILLPQTLRNFLEKKQS